MGLHHLRRLASWWSVRSRRYSHIWRLLHQAVIQWTWPGHLTQPFNHGLPTHITARSHWHNVCLPISYLCVEFYPLYINLSTTISFGNRPRPRFLLSVFPSPRLLVSLSLVIPGILCPTFVFTVEFSGLFFLIFTWHSHIASNVADVFYQLCPSAFYQ